MTEAEWLAAADPRLMLDFLRGRAGARKLRLFACACCRRVWDVLAGGAGRHVVEVAERFADGTAAADELGRAADALSTRHARLEEDLERGGVYPAEDVRLLNALGAAWQAARGDSRFGVSGICGSVDWARGRDGAEYPALCGLVRDVFGNPFRPVPLDPGCLTPDVLALARAAYDQRQLPSGHLDPARLAVLADALEEAGCAGEDVLAHLRSPGPHVRGCWPVDLALGWS